MATALVALATTTLGSVTTSVTFSSLPAGYRDYRLIITTKLFQTNAYLGLRFNGDSATNYSYVQMGGSGTAASSSALGPGDGITAIYVYPAGPTDATNAIVDIMDASATDKHKTVLARSNDASLNVTALAGRWANTAAVTSININTTNGNQWGVGSTFSLYGIVS